MLVAGLPEKYGCSLDFFLLAHEWGIRPIVVDQRQAALEKLARSIAAAQQIGELTGLEVDLVLVNDIVELNEVHGQFDLAICSEVLQGISAENRPNYLKRLNQLATQTAIFCPNADNAAHTNLSGLSGLASERSSSAYLLYPSPSHLKPLPSPATSTCRHSHPASPATKTSANMQQAASSKHLLCGDSATTHVLSV